MGMFDNLKNQANEQIKNNPDQVREGIDKGGDFVDEKTGNKYADQVDKAQGIATERVAGGNEAPQGQPDNPDANADR